MKQILVAALLFLAGCDSGGSINTGTVIPPNQDYEEPPGIDKIMLIPLEVGNMWIYDRFSGQDTTMVVGDTIIDGRTYYSIMVLDYDSFSPNDPDYLTYIDEGLEKIRLGSDGSLVSRYVYRYPDVVGSSFYQQDGDIGISRFDYWTVLVSTDSTVSTPTGIYQTLVYRTFRAEKNSSYTDLRNEEYFAPGLGIVFRKFQAADGWPVVQRNLVEMRIGSNPIQP